MDWRLAVLTSLALCRRLNGQNGTAADKLVSNSPSSLPSSSTGAPPDLPTAGGPLLVITALALLSMLCVGVMVTVLVVLVVRVRRALRRWRQTSHTPEYARGRGRIGGNGAAVHLLSAALSNHNFEWCRPRSLSPSSPTPSSPPHSPLPSTLHTTLPTHLPPSPTSTHDYSEINSLPPNSTLRPHHYEEVDEEDFVKTENRVDSSELRQTSQVHFYSVLENHTHNTSSPSLASNHHSLSGGGGDGVQRDEVERNQSRGSSPVSQCSSVSVQDSNPDWILSPVARLHPLRAPRRVIPYRVSLILPLWEGQERGSVLPLPAPLAGRQTTFSTSCQGLEESGHYNHLEGVGLGYGSLEESKVYATLEPFVGVESMRPRSRSCGGRLYNHLQH